MRIFPSPSKRTRREWQSVTRLAIVLWLQHLLNASPRSVAVLLRGGRTMEEVQRLQWDMTGLALLPKPLKLQVMPSPKRVSATRRRNQRGQKKSKKSTSGRKRVANSRPQLVQTGLEPTCSSWAAAPWGRRRRELQGTGMKTVRVRPRRGGLPGIPP